MLTTSCHLCEKEFNAIGQELFYMTELNYIFVYSILLVLIKKQRESLLGLCNFLKSTPPYPILHSIAV